MFEAVFAEHSNRLRRLLGDVEVVQSGGSCIGAGGDLDICVVVDDVAGAAERVRAAYPPLYEDEWREDWAAFRLPGEPQVDVVLVEPDSRADYHHRLAWQAIAADPGLRERYFAMRLSAGEDYAAAKAEFFDRLELELRGFRRHLIDLG